MENQKVYILKHPDGWSAKGSKHAVLAAGEHYCKMFGKDFDDLKIRRVFEED